MLDNFGASYALDYDAAGHATRRRFMQGGAVPDPTSPEGSGLRRTA